jgi:DNA-binding protein H-NS
MTAAGNRTGLSLGGHDSKQVERKTIEEIKQRVVKYKHLKKTIKSDNITTVLLATHVKRLNDLKAQLKKDLVFLYDERVAVRVFDAILKEL